MAQPDSGPIRPPSNLSALKPLAPFALAYRGRILAALLVLIVASGATLVVPLAVRRVVDHGFSPEGRDLIDAYFGMLVVVVGVLAAASAWRYYLVVTLGERVVADLRAALFRHLTILDPAFFDQAKSGEIVSRLTADTTQVKSAFGVSVSLVVVPLVVSGRAVRRRSRAAQDRLAEASAFAAEAVGAVRTMQAFGMARHTAERFAEAAEAAFEAARLSA